MDITWVGANLLLLSPSLATFRLVGEEGLVAHVLHLGRSWLHVLSWGPRLAGGQVPRASRNGNLAPDLDAEVLIH